MLPSKFLKYLYVLNESPNTIKAAAFALTYYYRYLEEKQLSVDQVVGDMGFHDQTDHFTGFLRWLLEGHHTERGSGAKNKTCNKHLRVVFQLYQFAHANDMISAGLKAITTGTADYYDMYGVKKAAYGNHFKGFLKEEDPLLVDISYEQVKTLVHACNNNRDRLLISIMAETGFRIGEVLGLFYTKDVNLETRTISVNYREGNENMARAKNAEHRSALLSQETFLLLTTYISENYELLKNTEYLFVKIQGKNKGTPMNADNVYSLFKRLEKKTGIRSYPHQLRHYFANERRKANWDLNDIRFSLGHKKIETTIKYLGADNERLTQIADQYFEENEELFMLEDILNAD